MSTIVEYTEAVPPQNLFPNRIISPPRSGPCCFTNTDTSGRRTLDLSVQAVLSMRLRSAGYLESAAG